MIPKTNVPNVALRPEVEEAVASGKFHVWAVETIQEALEVFTGVEAGVRDGEDGYPEGSLLARAVERAGEYWRMARGLPAVEAEEEEELQPEVTDEDGAQAGQ